MRCFTDHFRLSFLACAVVSAFLGAALLTAEIAPAPASAQERTGPSGGAPTGPAPSEQAPSEQQSLAVTVLASARTKYAGMRFLHADFEGAATVLGTERLIKGAIDWRDPDASRLEIHAAGGRTIRLQEGNRIRRWEGAATGELRELKPDTTELPPSPPLVPPFESIDESTLAIRDFKNEKGRPLVIELEARLVRPIDGFISTRLGIEDRSWLIRTLELRSDDGRSKVSVRFRDVRVDEALADGVFGPPRSRD